MIRTMLCNVLLLQTKLITRYLTFTSNKSVHTVSYCAAAQSHLAFSLNHCSLESCSTGSTCLLLGAAVGITKNKDEGKALRLSWSHWHYLQAALQLGVFVV